MPNNTKYNLLKTALEDIAKNAPKNLLIYHPEQGNVDAEIHKFSHAFIHLFLRVRFGLLNFDIAESQITDGANDGGLDAYHIEDEGKKIYLIQSKFSTSAEKFTEQKVNAYEFFKMKLDQIVKGENQTANSETFNGKIKSFQKCIKKIPDISRYKYTLIYLGNIKSDLTSDKLREITGNICEDIEIIDGTIFYREVLMPYLQHDFFNKKDFVLKIRVNQNQSNRITYQAELDGGIRTSVHLSFVPTKEIADMMSKYRNSLLRYNPRCYVGIKKGGVNNAIKESIVNTTFNEFSLLNNGITIICSDFEYTEKNAEPNTATLLVTNPQIVNGGQTAFTLAHLLEVVESEIFENKEVLTKFITITNGDDRLGLIDKVSGATNNQTPVMLSDRRSNDEELINLQDHLFDKYGLLLERKKGEFYDAIEKGLIQKDKILSSELLMRLLLVCRGEIARARSSGSDTMFKNYSLEGVDYERLYSLICIYREIDSLEQKTRDQKQKYRIEEWGNGLKYGKFAIAYVAFKVVNSMEEINEKINFVKSKWLDFENTVANHEHNKDYSSDGFDYANYYKGRTVNSDLVLYLKQFKQSDNQIIEE